MSLAVILDMDGLMLDTERISLRVWNEAATSLGLQLHDDICTQMIGLNLTAARLILRAHLGDDDSVERLVKDANARYRACLDDGVPHKAGLVDFLEFLDDRAIPRAVATSTGRLLARHKLERAGVLHYFGAVVGGDEVAFGKPAPDIFLAAAGRIGQLPADCVVLEDSGPGIRGAADAGMIPILIPDCRPPTPETRQHARFIVDSLALAQPVIDALLEGQRASSRP